MSPRNPVFHSFWSKRKKVAERPPLFVFFGFFGDFVAGLRHILAGACYRIAGTEERRRAEKDDKTGESDCKVLAHDVRL